MINLYFNKTGRLNRKEYWISLLLPVTLLLLSQLILILGINSDYYTFGLVLYGIVLIVVAWSSTIIIIKRLHDLNKSGSMAFLNFIPIINGLFIIVLGLLKGTQENNTYGEPSSSLFKKSYILPSIIAISIILIASNVYINIKLSNNSDDMTISQIVAHETAKNFINLPVKVDKKTTLVSVTAKDSTVYYLYQLDTLKKDNIVDADFMHKLVKENVCNSKDINTYLFAHNVSINYKYIFKDNEVFVNTH